MRAFYAAILLGASCLMPLIGPLAASGAPPRIAAAPGTTPRAGLPAYGRPPAHALQSGRVPGSVPRTGKKIAKKAISVKESAALRRRARRAIETGDLRQATGLLRQAAGVRKGAERQAWLLIEAELEFAKKNYARAGLAAMRLAILHPRSEPAGNALYWAGRAYEGLERPHLAAGLYDECLAHQRTRASIRKLAEARSAALRKLGSTL